MLHFTIIKNHIMLKNSSALMQGFICVVFFYLLAMPAHAGGVRAKEYYQLTVYHFTSAEQEKILDTYLEQAMLPALHRAGADKIGVFKSLANDTSSDKVLYVLVPLQSLLMLQTLLLKLDRDTAYQATGALYLDALYTAAPYTRKEIILLEAFPLAARMNTPVLHAAKAERVYELRSYESATEKIFANKVAMFNEGGEISLFNRLNFNAVFYSTVIAGPKMPNLMYMTCFENMPDRDKHWKAFVEDPFWKKLSSMPLYQNNVSHIDITFLRPTNYSDF
jgi:NIPSNAP